MFKVVILSANSSNLIACVRAVLRNEPELPAESIVVVDDGARQAAERQLPGVTWLPGRKPFVFARNANLGIHHADSDVILLNDDALLVTPRGFTQLSQQVQQTSQLGVCSAAIQGLIGNPRQKVGAGQGMHFEAQTLAFVCVYLPRSVYQQIGPLDERFVGYGFDDNDYCQRLVAAGYRLGIWDGCVVDHSGNLPSSFRTRRDLNQLFNQNRQLYQEKQNERGRQPADSRYVDLLYLAWNRLEFTQESFTALLANTDWHYVRQLFVCDDGSQDGTREWLESQISLVPAPVRFLKTSFGSPVAAMNHFIELAEAPMLAKTDNDAMLPPGWLRQSLDVMSRHPELSMLGIEAMYPVDADPQLTRSYTPAQFISGLGLYRRAVFSRTRPTVIDRYFGLEEWQQAQRGRLLVGWITPALPVFLLDRLPYEPWHHYSEGYIQRGWQRSWPPYNLTDTLWHWHWPQYRPSEIPATPTVRSRRLNIVHLADQLDDYTNVSILPGAPMDYVDLEQPSAMAGQFIWLCSRL